MKLTNFVQIGIITENAEESVRQFERFGIGPWEPMELDTEKIGGMLIDGKPGNLHIKGATFHGETSEIELLQPISESVFMDYLREHGPGVHHLVFDPEEGYDAFMEEFRSQGMDTRIEATFPGGEHGFTYLNTLKELGFYAEIHR